MNLSLYQIADQYLADIRTLEDMELDSQTLADTLEGLTGDFEVKAVNVSMFIRNLEASAESIKEAEKQMAERRKALEDRANSIKEYLKLNMQKTGITSIDCPYFKITLRNNPESVDVLNPDMIPSEYYRVPEPPPPILDKKALKEAIQNGVEVAGARLIRNQSIQIK